MTLILKNAVDEDILLFCAFRYALGRKTYVVGTIVDILKNNWNSISPSQRKLYKEEIRDAITNNRAGMDMDVDEWNKILALEDGEESM